MKKLLLVAVLYMCLFALPQQSSAQNCKDLQDQWKETTEKLKTVRGMRETYNDFFALMDNPNESLTSIPEEIVTCEHRIELFQARITGGDNSAATATNLRANRQRLELLKLRESRNFNKNTFFKDPRYLEQQKNMNNLSTDEIELKLEKVKIEADMKEKNCPIDVEKDNQIDNDILDDNSKPIPPKKPVVKDERVKDQTNNTTGTWAGKWLYKDPKAGDWLLTLVNGGASTTGVLYNDMEGIITRFDMKGCQDIGPNRLRCAFTALMEDEEKYLKSSGNVELTLTTNNLKTAWQESAPAEITWKPGFEKPLKRIGSARLFPLNFIRTFIN